MTSISAMSPLRERPFRWYFLSRSVNLVGNTMSPVALAFAVLAVDDGTASLGIVLAAYTVPLVVFLLLGGVLADRWGPQRVVQTSNVLAGLVRGALALLVVSGHAELWSMVVLAAANGVVVAPGLPAMNGIVPRLVPRDQLQQANALLSLTRASLMVIGPSVAAALVIGVGSGWALLIDAATWLVAALLLLPVSLPRGAATGRSMLDELEEGWHYFRTTTWLWLVVGVCGLLNALAEGGLTALGPVRAHDTSIGAHGWGLAMSAQALGALAMTLALMKWRLERPLVAGLLSGALFGLPMIALGVWPSTVPLMVAALLSGIGVQTFSLGWHVAVQENVPGQMLSRAYSYDQLGSMVTVPIGQLAMGPLAEVYGIGQVLTVAGCLYVAVSLLTLGAAPVRALARTATVPAATSVG
ncbi:MFS transporter [Nocardioides sp. CER19]|uniref:MFS transporter n=1 Tax=Nocardioides sp. CER19 TaxID=3038538 RepID=UPI00244C2CB6|nr:MFS transporter [Nocardioides sp. CER19]MDH2413998.1 MFS transporter [Nocardioides sp. CER19]